MKSERVSFPNSSGQTLSGVLDVEPSNVIGWAVFAHCFTCSKTSLAASRISRELASRGIGTLRFDFTGLGESDGDFSETGFSSNVDDLLVAAGWMKQTGRPVSLLIGHSLGGAASLVAANQMPDLGGVVTLGAPAHADHVIAQFATQRDAIETDGEAEVNLGGRPFRLRKSFIEDVEGARVLKAVAALRKPVLIMHAPTDQTVGIDNATELFVAARHPKSFVSLDRANHLLTRAEDAKFAADVIAGWGLRYLPDTAQPGAIPAGGDEVVVQETLQNGPYQNAVYIDGRRYLADEPKDMGGEATGPDPYAWVAAGLGACTSMTLRMYAARKNWPLSRITVRLNHQKQHRDDCEACGPADRIDVFSREILIEGELSDDQRGRLLEIADRCPVHRTLESEVKVVTRIATKPA